MVASNGAFADWEGWDESGLGGDDVIVVEPHVSKKKTAAVPN